MAKNTPINLSKSNIQRAYSLVVAASNSSANGIALADYVCDGTADDVQINAAITALSSAGGEVHLLEGTYNIAATINMANKIKLSGCGDGTILKLIASAGTMNVITSASVGSIEICNLQIDGNKTNNSAGNQYGINITGNYVKIHDTYIHDFRTAGISTTSAIGGSIDNNIIADITVYGLYITSSYTSISSNTIKSCANTGIYVSSPHPYVSYTTIANNVLLENANGINAYDQSVTGNYVKFTTLTSGVGILGSTIRDNNIVGYQTGISGSASAVSGNSIVSGENGIIVSGSETGSVSCNTISLSSATTQIGIDVNASYYNISGNRIALSTSSTKIGIKNQASYNIIQGNVITPYGGTAVLITATGGSVVVSDNLSYNVGTVIDNSAGATYVRANDNTGYSAGTMTSGTVTATAGNTDMV